MYLNKGNANKGEVSKRAKMKNRIKQNRYNAKLNGYAYMRTITQTTSIVEKHINLSDVLGNLTVSTTILSFIMFELSPRPQSFFTTLI